MPRKKPATPASAGHARAAPTVRVSPSDQPKIKRAGHKWQKGQSGNPGGRPKEINEVRDLARQYTIDAINKLVDWMKSDNAKASVSACNVLLDRGWGKAMQSMEVTGKDGAALLPVLNIQYGG